MRLSILKRVMDIKQFMKVVLKSIQFKHNQNKYLSRSSIRLVTIVYKAYSVQFPTFD